MFARLMMVVGVLMTALLPVEAMAERRVALVIGNSAYSHATTLRNPGNDASDVAETLRKLGFDVTLGVDLDQQNFARTIEQFARSLDDADVGLFFYAGHGLQMNDKNYLVSTNAKLENEFLLSSETIELDAIVRLMESKSPINLVFLDACRNNPLTENLRRSLTSLKRSAQLGRGLARMEASGRDTLVAFAAAPGQEAGDGADRNSPFTASLLKHLPKPGVEVSVMLKDVAADVRRDTRNSQRPQQLSDMTKAFYFAKLEQTAATKVDVPPAPELIAKPPVAPQSSGVDDRALDVAFWNASQSANDCDAVRAYLQRFPNGVFVELGKLSERRLCAAQRKVTMSESADRPEPAPSLNGPPPAPLVPAAPTLSSDASVPAVLSPPAARVTAPPAGAAIMAALPEPASSAPAPTRVAGPTPAELARAVQLELYRLGCGTSEADGKWNKSTREGLRRFSKAVRVKLDLDAPSDAAIAALQKQEGRVCPLECGRGFQARGNSCVAIRQEPPPKKRHVERAQRRRAEPAEASAKPAAAPAPAAVAAPAPMMMGPMGGPPMGGMFFFGMGHRR